jgi:hypothetical protein
LSFGQTKIIVIFSVDFECSTYLASLKHLSYPFFVEHILCQPLALENHRIDACAAFYIY